MDRTLTAIEYCFFLRKKILVILLYKLQDWIDWIFNALFYSEIFAFQEQNVMILLFLKHSARLIAQYLDNWVL